MEKRSLNPETHELNAIWDPHNDKFKVLCRSVHVTKAALFIGYTQLTISLITSLFFIYYYMLHGSSDYWMGQYSSRYVSQLTFAVGLKMIFIGLMIHGIKFERRSLLLPFIISTAIVMLAQFAQFGSVVARRNIETNDRMIGYLLAIFINLWCLSVVWRCYGYLGEKKVARQITDQLNATTHAAFQYPQHFFGTSMPQPPAYADTVVSAGSQTPPPTYEAPAHAVVDMK